MRLWYSHAVIQFWADPCTFVLDATIYVPINISLSIKITYGIIAAPVNYSFGKHQIKEKDSHFLNLNKSIAFWFLSLNLFHFTTAAFLKRLCTNQTILTITSRTNSLTLELKQQTSCWGWSALWISSFSRYTMLRLFSIWICLDLAHMLTITKSPRPF